MKLPLPLLVAPALLSASATEHSVPADVLELSSDADHHAVVHFDVDRTGTHWARGRDYKASAGADGFAFIPFLGSDAPRNYPVRFRLVHVARGGEAVDLGANVHVSRRGQRLVLDRQGVEVRYDLTTGSVEQSFALEAPSGTGDLVLSLAVETELVVEPEGGGFRFSNELGGMTYGAATVFDAEGRSASVPATWMGSGIDLNVPADFLDVAAGPIVVDPLMSAFAVDTFSADLTHPDVAYDQVDDKYCVVFQEQFSGNDVDVYSRFVDGTSGGITGGIYIDSTTDSWERPRIAQNRHSRKFLVVAQNESIFQLNSFDLVGRFRHASGALDPQFVLKAAAGGYSCTSPDIGSEAIDISSSYFCIAYNRAYTTHRDTWAIVFDNDGNYVGSEVPLATSTSRDELRPAVSKSTGTPTGITRYVIAWTVEDLNSGQSWVEACQLQYNGSVVHGPFQVTTPSSTGLIFDAEVSTLSSRRHPVTNDQYYLVTADRGLPSAVDVQVAVCSGTTVHSVDRIERLEHANESVDRRGLVVATTPEHFMLGFIENNRVYMTSVQPVVDELGILERRVRSIGAYATDYSLCSSTPYEGGIDYPDGLFVWTQTGASNENIFAAYGSVNPHDQVAGVQFCSGVANSTGYRGFIQAIGDRSRTQPQELLVESLPLNALGIFIASQTQGFGPNAGGGQGTICLGGSIGRFGVFNTGSNGRAQTIVDPTAIAQPSGTVSALSGQTWSFQGWHRDSFGGSATSNFTNGVAITFL